jgi:hypothetical protein
MPAAPAPPRRRRLPLLLSVLLLLLVAGGIAVGQRYWLGLRGSMDQLEASIARARAQQQAMIERVREAEAALAERAQRLGGVADGDMAVGADARDRQRLAALAAELEGLADALADGAAPSAAIDWPRLRAELGLLGQEATRLPPGRRPAAGVGGRELRQLLEQAGAAAALGDAVLTGLMLDAAQRLLRRHYGGAGPWQGEALALAGRIARLRGGLGPVPGDAAARLREIAGQLRGLGQD